MVQQNIKVYKSLFIKLNMQKRGLIIFSLVFLISFVFMFGVFAQDTSLDSTTSTTDDVIIDTPSEITTDTPTDDTALSEDDEVNALVEEAKTFEGELNEKAGITPDSGLYFIENIQSNFRGDARNREIKIAEMQKMMQEGNIDAARKSFERYQGYADDFRRDVSPEQRTEALRSSEAIMGVAIRDIAQNMPPEQKDEFVREIVLGEKGIATAAEIASKISELCSQLSQLDPTQYAKVCRIEGDAPDWRNKLDEKLTKEQRAEALEFGEIMSQCFESAGQDCKCEEIAYPDFAEACSVAAPLATACEIEKNEEACEQLDELDLPSLPPYLQDIMNDLESGMAKDKYGMFLPPECEDAGAKSPKECAKIMIQTHAPEECRPALLAANVQNERQGREICEKIMFEQNAPPECVEAGITNSGECGKYMFSINAPQECIDAGIDGTDRNDPTACRKLMESQFSGEGPGGCAPGTICGPGGWAPGTGPNMRSSGGDCKSIPDPMKRLECYEGATQYVQEFRGDFEKNFGDMQTQQNNCARDCGAKNSAWDFSNGNCVCKAPNFQEFQERHVDNFRQDYQQPYQQGDFTGGEFMPPEGMMPPQGFDYPQPPQDYQQPYQQPPQDYQQPTDQTTMTEPTTSSGDTSSSTSSGGDTSTGSGGDSGGSAPTTGGVIANSGFLRYWFFG